MTTFLQATNNPIYINGVRIPSDASFSVGDFDLMSPDEYGLKELFGCCGNIQTIHYLGNRYDVVMITRHPDHVDIEAVAVC